MSIAVFVNPRSRANRRDPRLVERFARIVEGAGQVLAPLSFEELQQQAGEIAAKPPALVAVHGGDGTLHHVVSALVDAHAGTPLPPIAILAGGTMNVVASSLGIRAAPERFLRELREDVQAGQMPETIGRRCLKVGQAHGFVFGNGLMVNFLEEYYARGGYGPGRAIWILGHTMISALAMGGFARRIFRRFNGRVWVDGDPLPWRKLTGVGAATVREVGLGFKLHHRADDDPERFGVLAIHADPLKLMMDVPAVHRGRGITPTRAWSGVASHMIVEPEDGEMVYTIDGDLYRTRGRLEISVGPALRLVRPRPESVLPFLRSGAGRRVDSNGPGRYDGSDR